jgi:hypothetical protein
MPREILTVQVGQCGNQMALAFWDLLLKEHLTSNTSSFFDESFSSFFKNVDSSSNPVPIYDVKSKKTYQLNKIQNLRARSVIVDTEEGVINQIKKSKLASLFEKKQVCHTCVIPLTKNNFIITYFLNTNQSSSTMYQVQVTTGHTASSNTETTTSSTLKPTSAKKSKCATHCSPSS